jgi:hypothetical protein
MARLWVRRLGGVAAAGLLAGTVALVATGQPASAAISPGSIEPASWAYVDSANPNASHFKPSGDLPVGNIHTSHDGNHVYRDYLSFDISQYLSPVQISTVQLVVAETQVPDCVDRSLQLLRTAPFNSSLSWRHQPTELQKLATVTNKVGSSSCPATYQEFDLTTVVRQAAAAGQHTVYFELRETDENNPHRGRWLGNDAAMLFRYNTPPDTPTPVGADAKACATTTPYPWVTTLRPTLFARATDPDGGQDGLLDLTFAVWPIADPANRTLTPTISDSNGLTGQIAVPAGVLADGGTYGWAAQTTDPEGVSSAWSAPCYFQVDTTPPAAGPTVLSADYPTDGGGSGGQGIPGTFTFSANGVSDVVGFSYGWNGIPQGGYVAADRAGGTATVSLSPPSTVNTLAVDSVDRAGNLSAATTIYQFSTAPTAPIVTATGQPKSGGSFALDLAPRVTLPGYQVVSYSVSVNGGAAQTVAAGPDGSATATVILADGFNDITVTSTSANGWVSTEVDNYYYADNSPTVSSPDFPENGYGGTIGQPGSFTFASNLAGSTEFYYSFDYGSTWQPVPVGADGTATISWTPDSAGTYLVVYSQTADGTQSAQYWYAVNVNG